MWGRSRRRGVRKKVLGLLAAAVLVLGAAPGGWAPPATAATEARITHSADGVALRADPTYGAEVAALLADGATVDLRLDRFDTVYDPDGQTRWWPVATDRGEGWVAGFFLDVPGWESRSGEQPADSSTAPRGDQVPAGVGGQDDGLGWGFAQVSEPDGVNLRADPSTSGEVLTNLRLGDVVALRIDVLDTVYADGTRWWPVGADGVEGWVSGDYLAPADADPADADPASEEPAADPVEAPEVVSDAPATSAEEVAAFVANAYVQVLTDDGAGLNIRADAAPDAERIGSIPESDIVQVMDGPGLDPLGNPWYLITDGETTGWVIGDYLIGADQPPAPDGEEAPAAPEPDPEPVERAGVATGSMMYPVERFTFTQGFGCSPYWFEPWSSSIGCNFHNGIDLAQDSYTPIMAADGGTVDQVGWCDCGLGYYVRVDHGNGFRTLYGHMAEYPWASVGQDVAKGDVIGPVGSTGNSTGPHLHFIVNYEGVDQDPLWYLP